MKDASHPSKSKTSVNAAKVARRSLVLAAVVCRGSIDLHPDQFEAESLRHRILEWLTKLDLWDEVEPSEEKLLRTPIGKLEQKDVIRATWYVEGLAILSWAMHRREFPRHDQRVVPYEVADSVSFLSEDAEELLRAARLRSRTKLNASRELLYDIHARLRDFLRNGEQKDFTHWVEKSWIDAIGLDSPHLIVDKDLAIDGKALSEVVYERVRECENITCERHRAIIWLVERYPSYSQTPVDT